jgi:MFS family permease
VTVTPEERNERATPESEGQLAWEARLSPRVGIAAALGAIFVAASFLVQLPLLRDRTKNEADTLHSVHRHATAYVTGGLLQLVALLCVVAVLWFLYRATKYRREQTPVIALVLGIAGPLLFALAGAIGPFVIRHFANEFAASANQSNQHAKDLVSGGSAAAFSIITPAAGLAFAFSMIMTNINAIRTGLVSMFVGIIGVIGGILFVLPLGPPQLLMFFWLGSVAIILLDRWPGGRGPAWKSGEAQKWPTAMERRGVAPGAGRSGPRGRQAPEPEAKPEDTQLVEPPRDSNQSRTSRKRKRKQGRKH